MPATIAETLAGFCTDLAPADLPAAVRQRVRDLTLDFLAVAARASMTESSRMVRRAAHALSGPGPSTVIGAPFRLAPQYAALANGGSSHAIELDDVTEESSLHPGVVVFPTALALAEAAHADLQEFVTAVVLGYEVICRLGNAINIKSHYHRGFHPTATCGTFAAAAVAARLMRLDASYAAHALAIAGSMAAGSMQYMDNGSLVKRVHPGMAAHAGIVAAHLASEGITGPRQIVEGPYGFLRAYSDGADPNCILANIGTCWEISSTAVKPHACCRHNHAAVDAALEIVRREDVAPGDVVGIRAYIPTSSVPIVAEPRAVKAAPKNMVDAQFSLPYALAVAVRYRRALLEEYGPVALTDSEVRRLLGVIDCVGDEALDRVFPATWPARVEIRTMSGHIYAADISDAKGSPKNPLTRDELRAKVRGLLDGVLAPADQAALIGTVENIEDLPDVTALLAPLASLGTARV